MNDTCLLIVFAKAPIAGLAKTRLAPALGMAGAAALAVTMLSHTLQCAVAASIGPVELCCAPDTTDTHFQHAAASFGVGLTEQGSGNLGERMERALSHGLQRFRHVVLIGTDAPGLDAAMLRSAAAALIAHDIVVAPASDGGYVLIGLSHPAPELFDGVTWSTAHVMAQTRARAAAAGRSVCELATLHDIDEPHDLAHVPPGWLA